MMKEREEKKKEHETMNKEKTHSGNRGE